MDVFGISIGFALTALLVSVRFAGVFVMSPLYAIAPVPMRIRVLLTVAMAALLTAGAGIAAPRIDNLGDLLTGVAGELVIGGGFAFGIFAAISALMLGGRILDLQMGFGVAGLIDPSTGAQAPMVGTLLRATGVIAFFALDGHHVLMRGLAYSLEQMPPGSTIVAPPPGMLAAQFGTMFIYGLAVVAPAVFAVFLLDVGMAVAGRTMPQVNMFIIGFPIKIFLGLFTLALSMSAMGPMLSSLYGTIFEFMRAFAGAS